MRERRERPRGCRLQAHGRGSLAYSRPLKCNTTAELQKRLPLANPGSRGRGRRLDCGVGGDGVVFRFDTPESAQEIVDGRRCRPCRVCDQLESVDHRLSPTRDSSPGARDRDGRIAGRRGRAVQLRPVPGTATDGRSESCAAIQRDRAQPLTADAQRRLSKQKACSRAEPPPAAGREFWEQFICRSSSAGRAGLVPWPSR